MIILDTNVVSEPITPSPAPQVLEWLDAQAPESLYLTAITVAELLAGVENLPDGRRKSDLNLLLAERVLPLFSGRILAFDSAAAQAFAQVNASTRAAGHPISFADGAIASIATAHGFQIATRNVKDFRGTGLAVFNPWNQDPAQNNRTAAP